MAANNLRVLYYNAADNATITATTSAASYPTSNMQNDIKGSVWRSTSVISNTITVNWATTQSINCIILPYTNLSKTATINITLYSGANATGTTLYTTGTINAVPYTMPTWDTTYTGVNAYSYGGGTLVKQFTPSTVANVLSATITIVDSANTQGYMEISRILAGVYWSPAYNTEFGLTVDYVDASSHSRSQAGNIITDIGPIHKSINFNLSYMTASDRNYLVQLIKLNGMRKPIYVSVFPNDGDLEKELLYQIYGKLSSNPTITHPMFTIYSSSITIEEI